MRHATDLLAAELERRVDLATLRRVASETFGYEATAETLTDPASLARDLARHCEEEGQLDALLDVLVRHRATELFRDAWEALAGDDASVPSSDELAAELVRRGALFERQPERSRPSGSSAGQADQRIDQLLERVESEAGAARLATLQEIAAIYEEQLASPREAFLVWLQALADAPDDRLTLESVERLAATRDEWVEAIDVLRDAAASHESRSSSRQKTTIAWWYAEHLEDHGSARDHLKSAGIEGAENDLLGRSVASVWTKLGQISEREARAGDAREEYRNALEADSSLAIAAEGAGRLAFESKDYEEALRWTEPLLDRLDDLPQELRGALCLLAGDAASALERWRSAQRSYLHAKALLPDNARVARGLAEVSWRVEEYEEAAEFYSDFLSRPDLDLSEDERSRSLFRYGESLRRSGRVEEAIVPLEQALTVAGDDQTILRSLTDVYAAAQRWSDAARTGRRGLAMAPEGERFDRLVLVGDYLSHDDEAGGARAYEEALELRDDDRKLLAKLMRVYTDGRRWSGLLRVLTRIAELEDDQKKRAKFHYTAGTILRRELKRPGDAAESYRKALDGDPTLHSAFDGLVDCLTEQDDIASLVAAYRSRLESLAKLPSEENVRVGLCDAMGDLLSGPGGDPAGAVEAYEQAEALSGSDAGRLRKIADLTKRLPGEGWRRAIAVHRRILFRDPRSVESYQALRELFHRAERPAAVAYASQVLLALGAGNDERLTEDAALAAEIGSESRSSESPRIKLGGGDELAAFFAAIESAVLAAAWGDETVELPRYQRSGDEAGTDGLSSAFSRACVLTGIALPPLMVDSDVPGGVGFAPGTEPGIVLGRDSHGGSPSARLRFRAGWHLAYFHPGHGMRRVMRSVDDLRLWMLASLRILLPAANLPGGQSKEVNERSERVRAQLSRSDLAAASGAATDLLRSRAAVDLREWAERVDRTADRVGVAVAGDLTSALAEVREGAPPDDRANEVREAALFRYVVSDEFLDLFGGAVG